MNLKSKRIFRTYKANETESGAEKLIFFAPRTGYDPENNVENAKGVPDQNISKKKNFIRKFVYDKSKGKTKHYCGVCAGLRVCDGFFAIMPAKTETVHAATTWNTNHTFNGGMGHYGIVGTLTATSGSISGGAIAVFGAVMAAITVAFRKKERQE